MAGRHQINDPARQEIPITYIWTIEKGKKPKEDEFYIQAERAKLKGWKVIR